MSFSRLGVAKGFKKQIASYEGKLEIEFELNETDDEIEFNVCKMDVNSDQESSYRAVVQSKV